MTTTPDIRIGKRARRTVSLPNTQQTRFLKDHEFVISALTTDGKYYVETDGFFHFNHSIDDCEILPVFKPGSIAYVEKREPIKPGARHGVVHVEDVHEGKVRILISDHRYCSADELREAAHLFNQLAEQLTPTPVAEREHNKSMGAAGGPLIYASIPAFEPHDFKADTHPWRDRCTVCGKPEYDARHHGAVWPIDMLKPGDKRIADIEAAGKAGTPVMGNVAGFYDQAVRLLHALHAKHWPELPPIEPLDTIADVLDQIDHITASLVRETPLTHAATISQPFKRRTPAGVEPEIDDTPMSHAEIRKIIAEAVAEAMKSYANRIR